MMRKYYIAVTYDVCEHNDLFIDMNNYKIESIMDLDKQIREIAKMDIASVVEVYEFTPLKNMSAIVTTVKCNGVFFIKA